MRNLIQRIWTLSFLLLMITALHLSDVQAQQSVNPVYSVSIVDWRTSQDGESIEIEFKVVNSGGAATQSVRTDIVVIEGSDQNRVLASADLRPLGALAPENEESMIMTAPLSSFPPGSRQVFRVQFVTPIGMEGRFNNSTTVSIDVPATGQTPADDNATPTSPDGSDTDTPETGGEIIEVVQEQPFTIPLIDVTIDLANRNQMLLAVGFGALVLLVILLLTSLIRSLRSKRPPFGNWHPPYATAAHLDPNSTAGIRQAWQQHANNNVIDTPATPGATHAVKQLIGVDGEYLSGWKVLSIRLNLYDQYGRVARTQTLASSRDIAVLNTAIRRRRKLKPERIARRLRPIAKRMVKPFWKRVSPRSAMLPVALDVRLSGKHGEVDIVFELYQFNSGRWHLLDQWSPEMMIVSKRLYDSYTYTIFGLSGGETMREYRQRLAADIERRLLELVGALAQQSQNASQSPDAPSGSVLTTSDDQTPQDSAAPTGTQSGLSRDSKPSRPRRSSRREPLRRKGPMDNNGVDVNGGGQYLEADDHDMNTVKSSSYFEQQDKNNNGE